MIVYNLQLFDIFIISHILKMSVLIVFLENYVPLLLSIGYIKNSFQIFPNQTLLTMVKFSNML